MSSADTDLETFFNATSKSFALTGNSSSSFGICRISSGERPSIRRRIAIIEASLSRKRRTYLFFSNEISTFKVPAHARDVSAAITVHVLRNFLHIDVVVSSHAAQIDLEQSLATLSYRRYVTKKWREKKSADPREEVCRRVFPIDDAGRRQCPRENSWRREP